MKKKLISILILLSILVSVVPGECFAQESAQSVETETYINPLYAEEVTKALEALSEAPQQETQQFAAPRLSAGPETAGAKIYRETEDEVVADLRAGLVARQKEICVYYHAAGALETGKMKSLMQQAISYTGNPAEGDYLRWQYGVWRGKMARSADGSGGYYYTLTYYFAVIPKTVSITAAGFDVTPYESSWYTTAAQEAEVDALVDKFMASEAMQNAATDYQKIKVIYNWLCTNVAYDYEHLSDDSYTLKHTAYAAFNGKAVCQGYALLFYRLALECGIEARLIAGATGGGKHAWNIARLGGKAYLLDATWDVGKTDYDYFLRGSTAFSADHTNYSGVVDGYDYGSDDYTTLRVSAEDFALSAEALGLLSGDLNGDAEITVLDLQMLYEYLAEKRRPPRYEKDPEITDLLADVNGDSTVNILDYQALYEKVSRPAGEN